MSWGPVAGPYSIHGHDNLVFRQQFSKPLHFGTKDLGGFGDGVKGSDSLMNEHFRVRVFREHLEMPNGFYVQVLGLALAVIVTAPFTPLSVSLNKGINSLTFLVGEFIAVRHTE